MSRHIERFGLAALFSVLVGASAGAQTQNSKWEAWLGCWRPEAAGPMRCIVPGSHPSAAFMLTIDSGRVLARDTVDASGAAHTIAEQGCAGSERGVWSNDERRAFIHSDVNCGTGIKRAANSIVGITPLGEWVDVQTILVGTNALVCAAHYRPVSVTAADLPAELANLPAMLDARRMSITAARTGAGSTLRVADIAEAVRLVDTTSVQAWLVERKTAFALDAKTLTELADGGVPGSVTDVMIGVSYPHHFAVAPARVPTLGSTADYSLTSLDSARIARDYLNDRYRYRYGYGYGYSSFYGLGYGAYGGYPGYYYGPFYGSTYYSGPVVSVKSDAPTHGRVVNGRGYTSGSTSTSSSGGFPSSGSSDASGSGSSASAGSSGSASSASSGGGDRTAHARPPR